MKRIRIIAVIAVIAVAAAFIVPRYLYPTTVAAKTGIASTGFIEAVTVNIAPEVGGRVAGISVKEGDRVRAGDSVVKLDGALLAAQRRQAEVSLDLAKANVTQATLAKDNVRKAWENARDVQLNVARLTLEQANNTFSKITYPYTYSTFALDVPAAVAAMNEAQLQLTEARAWLEEGPDSENYIKAVDQLRKALDAITTAQERLQRGQGADVFLTRRLPVSDFYTLRAAELEMEKAKLAVSGANASVDQAHTAYLQAENAIVIAGEGVKQAEAALNVIDVQAGKYTVVSPISGVVTAKNIESGEIAGAGTPVLSVTELDNMTLSVYIPESQIGLIKLGQKAQVVVDSYPGTDFTGTVTYISPRAVFTPGNIQLKDEREKTVFAVKISLSNPDQKLKSGMPADAVIITGAEE